MNTSLPSVLSPPKVVNVQDGLDIVCCFKKSFEFCNLVFSNYLQIQRFVSVFIETHRSKAVQSFVHGPWNSCS